jgi:hypothetical protein
VVRGEARSVPHPGAVQFPGRGNLSVADFRRVRGVCLIVSEYDEALPRGVVAPGAGVVGVAEPVVCGVEKSPEHHRVRHAGEVPLRVPCEVAGGSSLAEPQDDSSSAEALGSLTAGIWRPG